MAIVVRNKTDHPRVIRNRSDQDEVQVQPRAERRIDDKYLDFVDTSFFRIIQRPNNKSARVTHSTQRSSTVSNKEPVTENSDSSFTAENQKSSFEGKKKNK